LRRALAIALFAAGCYDWAAIDTPGDAAAGGDLTLTDLTAPDSEPHLDLSSTDFALPDLAMPDLATPDLAMPDLATPDLAVPDDLAMPPDLNGGPDFFGPDLNGPDLFTTVDFATADLVVGPCNPPRPPRANALTFAAARSFPVDASPRALAVGDLDGDCRPDVAVGHDGANTVAILLNDGQGGFGAKTSFAMGSRPFRVALTDLNSDGMLDLVSVQSMDATIAVRLGQGNGSFGMIQSKLAGLNPSAVAAARFDGDQLMDLLVTDSGNAVVLFFKGNNDGTFMNAVGSPSGSIGPLAIAVGSIDSDKNGTADVALACAGGSPAVLLGAGDGSFNHANLATGSNPAAIAVADIDEDGKADLAQANHGGGDVTLAHGKGDGTFSMMLNNVWNLTVGGNPAAVAIADLDGDSHPDLVVADDGGHALVVVRGAGGGTFNAPVRLDTGMNSSPYNVAVADFNSDGRPDIAWVDSPGGTLGLFLNTSQ
jgi:hypothetical protein